MVRIAGSLINGLLQSFQSIHALTGEDVNILLEKEIKNEDWYPHQLFQDILAKVEEKHADIKGLIFRAGIEFIRGWYHFGGGKNLVKKPIDILYIQTDTQGYHSVVKGDEPNEAGWLRLVNIDHEEGFAEIQSVVPFPPEFSQGVFVGGMNLLDGFDYVNVDVQEEPSTVENFYAARLVIHFKEKTVFQNKLIEPFLEKNPASEKEILIKNLAWKFRGLEQQIAYEKIYRDQLNEILVKTTEDIQSKNIELNRLIEELKTTQNQLIQQEKMASLGQLTAGVAHEINNPVNFVMNNSVVLDLDLQDLQEVFSLLIEIQKEPSKNKLDALSKALQEVELSELIPEIFKLTQAVKSGSERIANIVKSLQYLSYTDQENKILTDIREPIEATLTILNAKIKDRIVVEKNFSDCPEININAPQINQVLLNILNNAIQAIENNGQIKINTFCNDNQLHIHIQDNGIGMSEKSKDKIFEPFYTTKKIGEGTGLGLSISYGIIQSHQGKIEVESEVGKGSIFRIRLPYN